MSTQSRQYEQYLISRKVDELKSSNPGGTNKENSDLYLDRLLKKEAEFENMVILVMAVPSPT